MANHYIKMKYYHAKALVQLPRPISTLVLQATCLWDILDKACCHEGNWVELGLPRNEPKT